MVRIIHNFALLLISATYVLSACDFSTNVCEISDVSCPSTSNTLFTNGSNAYSSANIDVLSFSDITLGNSNLRGRVATRNNLFGLSDGFTIGQAFSNSGNANDAYPLIVGQSLFLNGSAQLLPDNAIKFIGAGVPELTTGSSGFSFISTCGNNSGCLNGGFDSSQSYWTQFSNSLASHSDNVNVNFNNLNSNINVNPDNRAVIVCNDNNGRSGSSGNRFYYVTLNPTNLTNGFTFSGCSSSGSLVINWSGSDSFNFVGTQAALGGNNNNNNNRGYIIYNFPSASSIFINSTSFYGNIIAPSSSVFIENCNFTGSIIAGSLRVQSSQINQLTSCRTSSTINESSGADLIIFNLVMTLAAAAMAFTL